MNAQPDISPLHMEMIAELGTILAKLEKNPKRGVVKMLDRKQVITRTLDKAGIDWTKPVEIATAKARTKAKARKPKEEPFDDDYLDSAYSPSSGKTASFTKSATTRCHHSHPTITFEGMPGSIRGGSCFEPKPDYDAWIFLDAGARTPGQMLPWGMQYIRFTIVDQQAPADFATFDKLIDWTIEQMKAGKKIHVGCIGGHGRTGLFLAALTKKVTGEEDAITWVREHHCKKAVESTRQVNWLHEHYGIKKVEPRHMSTGGRATTPAAKQSASKVSFYKGNDNRHETSLAITALRGTSVWGKTKLL